MGCHNSKVAVDGDEKVSFGSAHRFKKQKKSKIVAVLNESQHGTMKFKYIISDSVCREYFLKFMMAEHSAENLAFYQDIESLRNGDPSDLVRRSKQLAALYLAPGAQMEVNVSYDMKKNIIELLQDGGEAQETQLLQHLVRAQNEVLLLMAMGSFPRFLRSSYCQDYYDLSRKVDDSSPPLPATSSLRLTSHDQYDAQ